MGIITGVIIHPRNRLVTHAVVRVDGAIIDGELAPGDHHLVPVESIDFVNMEGTFLGRNEPPLSAYPAFDPRGYPLAPRTWKPPFPYKPANVYWSLEDVREFMEGSDTQRAHDLPDGMARVQ